MEGIGKKVIIFIPGFKGSVLLRTEDNKHIWLSTKEILFGNSSIKLSLVNNETTYKEGGILNSVPVIPKIFEINFYKSFLNNLINTLSHKYKIINFSYDWRMDIISTVLRLNELIESLKSEYSINIIAHSMGGLITSYFLRYGLQLPETCKENWAGAKIIDKVVLAGVPFQGSVEMFCEIQNGSKVVFNRNLLDFETMSSFQSAYQLLPSPDIKFIIKDKKLLNL